MGLFDAFVQSRIQPLLSFLRPAALARQRGEKQESRVSCENRNPVFKMVPCVRRDDVWTPAGVYPDENRGRSDDFGTFYEPILFEFYNCFGLMNLTLGTLGILGTSTCLHYYRFCSFPCQSHSLWKSEPP